MKVTGLHLVLVGITLTFVSITNIHCEKNPDCINCFNGCNNLTGYCNGSCLDGYYGSECSSTCQQNCLYRCHRSTGECTYCKRSYYGVNCTDSCPERCYKNYCNQSGICNVCERSFYGDHCEKNCPPNCFQGGSCDQHTGECTIACDVGFWGNSCENNCSNRCESCDRTYGICSTYSCKPGYGGFNCQLNCIAHCDSCSENDTCNKCSKGWFGKKCELQCSVNCRYSACMRFDGFCTCSKGWYYEDCHKKCIKNCDSCIDNITCNVCSEGYFGRYCENSCPNNCTKCTKDGAKCTTCNSMRIFGDQCTCDFDQCLRHESGSHCVECKNSGWYPEIGGCCRCSDNCKGGHLNCDNTTGVCLDGCESGYYGTHCVDKCSSHCIGNDTVCNSTTGVCPSGCEPDWYYSTCKYGCSLLTPHCAKCTQFKNKRNYEYASCDACNDGFYKPVLENFCAPCEECLNDKCNGSTGDCLEGCKPGWYVNPYRLPFYCRKCGDCIDGLCDPINGTCIHGCKNGLKGDICFSSCLGYCLNKTCDQFSGDCIKCIPGHYGNNCFYGCGNCLGGTCNQTTGICEDGCTDGFFGPKCSESCSQCMGLKCDRQGVCMSGCLPGKYGIYCNETCADNCLVCHPVTGQCLHVSPLCNNNTCTMNFTNSVCPPGKFGSYCNLTCSITCSNTSLYGYLCEKYNGSCIETCAAGRFGLFCDESCGKCASAENTLTSCNPLNGSCVSCFKGYYGKQCFKKCSASCFERDCYDNGVCSHGCESGWEGTLCEVNKPAKQKRISGGSVAGIVSGCVAAVILFVILSYFIYRRTSRINEDNSFRMNKLQY